MSARPVIRACEDPAMPQQEQQELPALATYILGRSQAAMNQLVSQIPGRRSACLHDGAEPNVIALVLRTSLSNRHRVLQLCCIKADKYLAMLSHGLFLRA